MNRIIGAVLLLLCAACSNSAADKAHDTTAVDTAVYKTATRYTKLFTIIYHRGYKEIAYLNPENASDTIRRIYLTAKGNKNRPEGTAVEIPLSSASCLSSVFTGFIDAIGETNSITSVDNISYVNNPVLLQHFKTGVLREAGEEGQLNIEQLAMMKPGVVFSSLFGGTAETETKKLQQFGIPMVICNNYMESDPLARAEWIKFFAAFYNKEKQADSIFNLIEKNYLAIKAQAANAGHRPRVMTEVKFGDAWNIPGGNSYTANLISDAGAKYIFDYKTDHYTYPLSIEVLLKEAADADFWINCGTFTSLAEIQKSDSRYTHFKPYTTGGVYNNNKQLNAAGGNGFWEYGPVQPDKVLADLIQVFHPEIKLTDSDSLVFYRKLQ